MNEKSFAAFILTHGRADNVLTYNILRKHGYTGKIYLVCDDEDTDLPEYIRRYGDNVIVFSKKEYRGRFDLGDNFTSNGTVTFARNAIFDIAKKMKVKYFMQLDDDYTAFYYKFDGNNNWGNWQIRNLDKVIDALLTFYKETPALSIAMAQGGDFIGGHKSGMANAPSTKRKVMNTWICSTDRPFETLGRLNDDVNTFVNHGSRGELFIQINHLYMIPKQTQLQKGGLTTAYLERGTYVKSFYTVMYNPSSVTVYPVGEKHMRLHHRISSKNTYPEIIDEKHKK